MRTLMRCGMLAAVLIGAGCESTTAFLGSEGLPVGISVQVAGSGPDQPVTISAVLRNLSDGALELRMSCTVIGVDREEAGGWVSWQDFRLCAPPDRITLPARASLSVTDQRLLSAGRYRVVVEGTDDRRATSEPFSIAAP